MTSEQTQWDDCLQVAHISDVGMRRANNQDSHSVVVVEEESLWRTRGHLLVVADGMGAHAAGELASKIAAESVPHRYYKLRDLSPPEALQKAIIDTNDDIHRRGEENTDFHNMGTTCSALAILPQGVVAAHVGDSRVYRLRGEHLEQLTFDHSLVWEMRAAGQLPDGADLARVAPKNVITRSLGPNATVQVDLEGPLPVEVGDTFLLCSDGLTGQVDDDEIGPILAALEPEEAVRVLVDLANLRGGPDNITVVAAKARGKRISTREAGGEPLVVGRREPSGGPPPALWVVLGVCLLAALILALIKEFWPATAAAVGALLASIAIVFTRSRGSEGSALSGGRRLGKGPYQRIKCPANAAFVQKLSNTVDELREAAVERSWDVDWSRFDELCQNATEAQARKRHADAVREFGRAISFMMQELRSQNQKKASDSTVDL